MTEVGKADPDGNWTRAQDGGDTVFAAFPADSEYWQAERQVMFNLRVAGLDALLARLTSAGIEIGRRDDMDGIGRFARIHDCGDNPIELWEQPSGG